MVRPIFNYPKVTGAGSVQVYVFDWESRTLASLFGVSGLARWDERTTTRSRKRLRCRCFGNCSHTIFIEV